MTEEVKVNDLFKVAGQDGLLSPQSVHALTVDPDFGNRIKRVLGKPVKAVGSQEVINLGLLIDDSGSISYYGNTQNIRDGYNLILDSAQKSKQMNNLFVHGKKINGDIITPFTLIDLAPRLDSTNYNEKSFKGTPLYDSSFEFLGAMMAETERYRQSGIYARGISVIISDGCDEHSSKHRNPNQLKQLVMDMSGSEDHIVVGVGVKHGNVDFSDVFCNRMGLNSDHIFTSTSDPSEIRKLFQLVSLTVVNLSKSAALFSQGKTKGFGGFV
jgi:hypothetical protein